MKAFKNLTSINKIKKFNLKLINDNFKMEADELSIMKDKLKCNEGICEIYNQKILNKENFIYCYLPLPIPRLEKSDKVKHFIICKEPSTRWANNSQESALTKVINGDNINFIGKVTKLNKLEILFIAFFNTFNNEKFYITDLSKCAINVNDVKEERNEKDNSTLSRYDCCKPLLEHEIKKLTDKETIFYFVGENNEDAIDKYKNLLGDRKFYKLPHYAIQISCPDHVNEMIYYYNKDIREEKLVFEIQNGFNHLNDNLTDNFHLSFNIKLIEKESIKPTLILLYLVYKSYFENVKNSRKL